MPGVGVAHLVRAGNEGGAHVAHERDGRMHRSPDAQHQGVGVYGLLISSGSRSWNSPATADCSSVDVLFASMIAVAGTLLGVNYRAAPGLICESEILLPTTLAAVIAGRRASDKG